MVNRLEIHSIWSGLVQAWKAIWQDAADAERWAAFAPHCDRLMVLARQQGLTRMEAELMPLLMLLQGLTDPSEEDKAVVDRLLPGVFAAVREVCSEGYENDARGTGIPVLVMLVHQTAAWQELIQQMEQYGYSLKVFSNYRLGMQAAITARAIAVVVELGTTEDAGVMTLIDELNRYGPKWFALAKEASFAMRLEAVRHASQGFFLTPLSAPVLADAVDPLTFKIKEEPYRVLILDDSPTVLASIRKALDQFPSIHTQTLRQPEQVLDVMGEFSPDVLLLDFHMNGCNGLEVAKIIRQNKTFESVPIVYLTAETSEHVQLEAMRHGGDDFLTKPISQAQLVNTVISKAERYRGLRKLMVEDSLTGLFNHVKTKTLLQQAILMAERQKSTVSYAMLDIDHFKKVNDTYGHSVGDKVIRALARFLKQQVRRADVVGRYGGEEFVVVFFDCTPDDAYEKLNEMRDAFALVQHTYEGGSFAVTFSAGIAHFPDFSSMAELVVAADEALYAAKRAGRNRVMRPGQEVSAAVL
ncbi:MAG: Diguanylate cyclase response regulator [Rhodocyclales bacterium]|nr:Diguanylate cyclase response regulator [Rhodocyclales bacterium]